MSNNSILSKIRYPRTESTVGTALGTHYANQECPPYTENLNGRFDYMSQVSSFGRKCLSSQDSYANLLPQFGVTYGERVDGSLPSFNDGSTATMMGGDVATPTRNEYDLNIPMSQTLPVVDGLSGTIRNHYNNGKMNLYPPRGSDMAGPSIAEPQMPVARRTRPPNGLDLNDYVDDEGRDYETMYTAITQRAPLSVVRTSTGGPGVAAPIGGLSRKNALYNAKLAQLKTRAPYIG